MRGDSLMRTALVFYSLKRAKCAYINVCVHVRACTCTYINAFNIKVDLNASLSILTSSNAKVRVARLG